MAALLAALEVQILSPKVIQPIRRRLPFVAVQSQPAEKAHGSLRLHGFGDERVGAGVRPETTERERSASSLPLPTYSASGVLPQGPGHDAQSPSMTTCYGLERMA